MNVTKIISLALLLGAAANAQNADTPSQNPAAPLTSPISAPVNSVMLPDSKPFNNPVSLTAPVGGISLNAALTSLGRAVNLTVVTADLPATQLNLNFKNRPFREILDTLVRVYGGGATGYQLIGNDVLVIGSAAVISRLNPVMAQPNEVTELYEVNEPKVIGELISSTYGAARVVAVGNTLIVVATPSVQSRVADLVTRLKAREAQNAPVALPGGGTDATPKPVIKTYALLGSAETLAQAVSAFYPELKFLAFKEAGQYALNGLPERISEAEALLSSLNRAPQQAAAPELVENTFELLGDPGEITEAIKALIPQAQVTLIRSQNSVIVRAVPEDQVRLIRLMNQINTLPVAGQGERGVAQRVFVLSHANPEVIVPQIEAMLGSLALTANDSATSTAAPAGQPAQAAPEAASEEKKAATVSAATPNDALAAPGKTANGTDTLGAIKKITTSTGVVTLVSDKRTGTVLATGTARQLQMISSAIAALDMPTTQVRLKIRVERMTADAAKNLGLDWKIGAGGLSIGGGSSGLAVGYNLLGGAPLSLDVKLDALKKNNQSKTVTNSSLMVNNLNTVALNTGGTLFIKSSVSSGGENSAVATEFQPYNYGMNLNFTPKLGPKGDINLQVATLFTNKPSGDFTNFFTVDGQTLNTNVNLMNGQTVVLGGVVTTTSATNKEGVPLLSDIPLLGSLFSKTSNSNNEEALLIMITGEIVDEQGRPLTQTDSGRSSSVPVGQPAGVPVGR